MKTVVKSLYRDTEAYGGNEVTVSGWVRTVRASNNFGFIELNDGSFFSSVQVVIEAEKLDNYTELAKLN
ncbi:MAG: OB-fold nucleic acid binding domain-containing protein, partial [Candidatus Ornithomonoglobus sp.]